jgi:hypothetical protein
MEELFAFRRDTVKFISLAGRLNLRMTERKEELPAGLFLVRFRIECRQSRAEIEF